MSVVSDSAVLFVESQQKSQALEFASYISKYRGEAEETPVFLNEARSLAEADNPGALYGLLARSSSALLNAPEKEFEGAYNLLIALFQHVPKEARPPLVKTALKILVESDTDKVALKLKVFSNLYNTLASDEALRYDVYSAILAYANKADELDKLRGHLTHLESWTQQWGVSAQQIQLLMMTMSEMLQKRGYTKDAYNLLMQHLQRYTADDASSGLPIARRAVTFALSATGIFAFDELAKLAAVQQLQKSAEKADNILYNLLTLFLEENLSSYHAYIKANPTAVQTVGNELSEEGNVRKMRLLTLAAIGTKKLNEEIPYNQIAAALEIDEDEVELWVIDVIHEGLVEAKMNQLNQTVTISRSAYRQFGQPEWEQLGSRLHAWRNSLSEILQVIGNAKLLVSGGQTVGSMSVTGEPQEAINQAIEATA